ncbi:U1 small nuclear ribonucleoprotein A isoform X3 [Sitodiplosis mosellana]|uniref:U1 small nuclear ribonucleoprotein A isoform X3 n=1 Tax=Sitodiplosis mosellana TaxID=263140 RepID=UPI002444A40D|nr:U1 small nuclear ribonucleoprotein A isoform X3 [Sitodiplosis mosellana]
MIDQPMQNQITLQHPSAMHPQSMQVSAGLPPGHFLPSPALASPVGSTGAQQPNPPLAANAPCSTLFVANLGQFVSEHELKEIFASLPGFSRLRMHTKGTQHGSVPVAFVEFKDAACAGSAISALQGTFLLSSDRGAIRIEYAKSKMVADAAAAIAQLDGKERVWNQGRIY